MAMTDSTPEARAVYVPSGRVAWLKFVPGVCAAGMVTVAMAWCLYLALQKGFYLILVAPLVASLVVAAVWYLVLTWSHCRNQAVASSTSVSLALLLYFGSYHVGLLHVIGLRNAHRIDLWPR